MTNKIYQILHIEDNPGDALLLNKCLESTDLSYNIVHKENIHEATSWLKMNRCDVVLLDLGLPDTEDLSGVDAVMALAPDICLIVITGNDNFELGRKAMQKGAQDYLNKNELSEDLIYKTISFSYERHVLTQEVKRSEQQLKVINDTVKSVIFKVWVEGEHQYRYAFVNHAFASRSLKSEPQIVGKLLEEVMPNEVIGQIYEGYSEAIKTQKTLSWEMKIPFVSGETHTIVTVTPYFNSYGQCEYLIGSEQDLTEINRANAALKENEAFLKTLFENTMNAILVADDCGNYTAVNDGAVKLFGYSKKELLSMKVSELQIPDGEEFQNQYESFVSRNAKDTDVLNFIDKYGNHKCAIYQATRLSRDFNVATLIDITDRVENELKIKRLSLIAQETINGAVITDRFGRITWANPAMENRTGYSLVEMLGRKPGEIFQGPETDPEVVNIMRVAVKQAQPFDVDVINYKKSGEKLWVRMQSQPILDKHGKVEGFFALQTDITQKKNAERQLQSAIDRLDMAIESASLGIIDWNIRKSHVDINDKCYDVIGHDKTSYKPCSDSLLKVTHPQDRDVVSAILHQVRLGSLREVIQSLRIIDRFQKVRWLNVRGTVYFEGDQPIRFIGVAQNITAEVEQEQRVINATLVGQDKERQRISQEIHDGLQQTLITSLLNLESVKSKLNHVDNGLKERFERGVAFLNSGINETRSIAHKLMPRAIKDFGYADAVRNMIISVAEDLIIDYYDNFYPARLDEDIELNLYRVTQEAITNILKHAKAKRVNIQLMRSPGHVILTIEDDGIGFDVRSVFNTSGLQSMQNRATAMGGTCEIDSSIGRGSHIIIDVPLIKST